MQTQMGKLNQILFLTERSDTIESCFINTKDDAIKIYFNKNIFSEQTFIIVKFDELDKTIQWLKKLIKTEINESYDLANMKHRDYIRYYL